MARCTKAEDEQTRLQIIDTARQAFLPTGAPQIAGAAGVARGAVSWRFKDKREILFGRMRRWQKRLFSDGRRCDD